MKEKVIEKLKDFGVYGEDYKGITCLIKNEEDYIKLYDYLNQNKDANINDILDYTFGITGTEEEEYEVV